MTHLPSERPMSRPIAGVMAAAGLAVALHAAPAQQPVFRSAVDLVAVDVQVVDDEGNPVAGLGPDAFEVSIDGRRRRVASAELIRHTSSEPSTAPTSDPPAPAAAGSTARTLILAVDSGSFDAGAERPSMEALRDVIATLGPDDRLGLYVYPNTVWIPPGPGRAAVRQALDRVRGEKQTIRSRYNLRPWEIVDISTQWTNPNSFLTGTPNLLDPVVAVQRRECPGEGDCPNRIYVEGIQLALQIERDVHTSIAGLEVLLDALTTWPGRKSVVLVSAGLLVSDRVDGRPDAGETARLLGQTAARANATVYTVHVDTGFRATGTASRRGPGNADGGRERALVANWLDEFSDASGGRRFYAPVGGASFAFARVLRESSAFYLLGVEPAEADRNGEARRLRVRVDRRHVSVRSRQWVVLPPRPPA